MSVMDERGQRVILPRLGPDDFWRHLAEHYAGRDAVRWKYLAMLVLRETAGWPLERIGRLFGHPKGHVSRCLKQVRRELRERFRLESAGGSQLTEVIPHE